MAHVSRHLRVTGLVQGVFFRAWTQQQARELGVTGWVRNCPDGSVEAQMEGEAEAVEAMVAAMRLGPDGAKVQGFEIDDTDADHSDRFEIRH